MFKTIADARKNINLLRFLGGVITGLGLNLFSVAVSEFNNSNITSLGFYIGIIFSIFFVLMGIYLGLREYKLKNVNGWTVD